MTYDNHHYNRNLKHYARELRTNSQSNAEKRIWQRLLRKKQMGTRFLRQRAIDNYIVDFFAPDFKLIIEIDGSSHHSKSADDAAREYKLKELGYHILRFPEGMVLSNLTDVELAIVHALHCIQEKQKL